MSEVEFGSLFQFIRNGLNVRQDKSGEGLPITRIETIADAVVNASRVGYAGLGESNCREWLMQPGDILFSHINSVEHIGKCAVYQGVPEKLVHGMNLLCLRCDTAKLLPEFAKYLIRSPVFRARLASFINKAVNQASVSVGNLKTIPVRLPSLAEQRRIAEVLDRAEALRGKRREILAQLDTLVQAFFVDLFGDPTSNPKGWPRRMLGELVPVIRNGVDAEQRTDPNGWPITRIETIAQGVIDPSRVRWIEPDEALVEDFQLQPGDILFSHINSVEHIAKTALYTGQPEQLIHGINLLRLRPDMSVAEPVWLLNLLKHSRVRTWFRTRCKRAVNQASLNQQDLKSLETYLPPLSLQREFAVCVATIEKLRNSHRVSLAQLDALFLSLQHRAFQGEL